MTDDRRPTHASLSDGGDKATGFGPSVEDWPMIDAAPEFPAQTDGLSRIMYKSRQWAVTEFGIERIDGEEFAIHKDDLVFGPTRSWIDQMRGRPDVDLRDFTHALAMAFLFHRHEGGQQD